MSNFRTSADLLDQVLTKCGELTNGTSAYDANALTYMNSVYRGLLSGGNEFGVDVADPWVWARAKRPIVLSLLPPYETGTVTMTNGSNAFTFSSAPALSMKGRLLKIEGRSDYFMVAAHTAGASSAYIDQDYTDASGTLNFKCIKLDYDLVDDSVVVDETNYKLDFQESGSILTATLTKGIYSPDEFAAHVQAQMRSAGALLYVHTWDSELRLFTWTAPTAFSFRFVTGTNKLKNPSRIMGLDVLDYASITSQQSAYTLNGINRLTGPIRVAKMTSVQWDSVADEGKIFEVSENTLYRDYPMTTLLQQIPDRFSCIRQNENGIFTVRFNSYVSEETRIEVPYIPHHQDLQDNAVSVPCIPLGFREYLVHGAASFIMDDKSDDKAEKQVGLAKAKLLALQHHNRKQLTSVGRNFGRIMPRQQATRRAGSEQY